MSTNQKSSKPTKSSSPVNTVPVNFLLKKENYYLLGAGVLLLIVGYFLMSGGQQPADQYNMDEIYSFTRVTLSPIIIIIGYIVIGVGIMYRAKSNTEK